MYDLTDIRCVRHLMEKNNLQFHKKFGQNFLIDASVVDSIAESSGAHGGVVLEIGPGIGTMTQKLCQIADKVVAVEIDKGLVRVLAETLSDFDNVKVVHGDILKTDLQKLVSDEFGGQPVHITANLPYYITTPIIMNVLESGIPFADMTVMVQKEVAQRMCAGPGTKAYGALSIAVQFYTDPRILFTVPPHCFVPQPEVDSTVIQLVPKQDKPPVSDREKFFRIVSAAFSQRRKTLVNAIANSGNFQMSKEEIAVLLQRLGISASVRGEALNIADFCQICEEIY